MGPALTVRNTRLRIPPSEVVRSRHTNLQADTEAHNLTTPGDILVIQGHQDVSNIGGMSSMLGKRQGSLGGRRLGRVPRCRSLAVDRLSDLVDGRDADHGQVAHGNHGDQRGPPVRTILVGCGDIVVADDSGVCFIPRERAVEVVERAQAREQVEQRRMKMIEDGVPILEMPGPNIELGEE